MRCACMTCEQLFCSAALKCWQAQTEVWTAEGSAVQVSHQRVAHSALELINPQQGNLSSWSVMLLVILLEMPEHLGMPCTGGEGHPHSSDNCQQG